MTARSRPIRYSANVTLILRVGDQTFNLAKIGPDCLVLRTPMELPPCCGEIIMTVDGHERRWPIRLHNGAVPFDEDVEFEDIPQAVG